MNEFHYRNTWKMFKFLLSIFILIIVIYINKKRRFKICMRIQANKNILNKTAKRGDYFLIHNYPLNVYLGYSYM